MSIRPPQEYARPPVHCTADSLPLFAVFLLPTPTEHACYAEILPKLTQQISVVHGLPGELWVWIHKTQHCEGCQIWTLWTQSTENKNGYLQRCKKVNTGCGQCQSSVDCEEPHQRVNICGSWILFSCWCFSRAHLTTVDFRTEGSALKKIRLGPKLVIFDFPGVKNAEGRAS